MVTWATRPRIGVRIRTRKDGFETGNACRAGAHPYRRKPADAHVTMFVTFDWQGRAFPLL